MHFLDSNIQENLSQPDSCLPCAANQLLGENAATVELEALPIQGLKRRIEQTVSRLIDFDRWNRQVEIQNVEFASIRNFADTIKNLPQIGGTA
jgi:hypothetical protein